MSEQTSDKNRAVGQAQTDADKFSDRDVKFMRAALDALKDCQTDPIAKCPSRLW